MNVNARSESFTKDYLTATRAIAGLIETEAPSSETRGELTPAVVQAMREAGLFWMTVPKEFGGGGADLLATVAVNEELARADGSAGWCFMANYTACVVAATYLGDSAVEEMYGQGKLPILAGAGRPSGKARLVDGGIECEGLFGFGSGSTYSDYVSGAMMLVDENDNPVLDANGQPTIRLAFVPREKIEFLGNWEVDGLKGTGSVDFRILPQFVSDDFAPEGMGQLQRGGSFYSLGMFYFALCGHASVALGLMKRALEEIATVATKKRRWTSNRNVVDSPLFLNEFAEHEADYRSARAYLMELIGEAQAGAIAGEPMNETRLARLRQATLWAHRAGLRVVGFAYKWAGSDAVRLPNKLARVMDDIRVANQHVTQDPGVFAEVAPTLLKDWARS